MPHKCTNCETKYANGDDQILTGCTECGGQKFEFVKSIEQPPDETPSEENTDGIIVAEQEGVPSNDIQQKARSETISEERLRQLQEEYKNKTEDTTPFEQSNDNEEPDSKPDMDELRDTLNEQFEGIKILEPGKYELNLMELYERDEHIISLQEDGRYIIQFPEDVADEN